MTDAHTRTGGDCPLCEDTYDQSQLPDHIEDDHE